MKIKKYLLVLLLTVILSCNKIYAANSDKCYYLGDNFKATFFFDKNHNDVYVDKVGERVDHDAEDLLNWRPVMFRGNTTTAGHTFADLYSSLHDARTNGACPNYIVIQYCKQYFVWGTNDLGEAVSAAAGIDAKDGCIGKYASFKNADGSRVTGEQYYSAFITPGHGGEEIPMDNPDEACSTIFGDINDAGTKDKDGNTIDPPSLAYLINSVLKYIRIIVPILIILLGSFDLAKAVVASKPDEMKKAQKTFAKRLIAGVVIFFVPLIVNLVMQLADIVWDGLGLSHCNLP